jgi:hypothetical protein
LISVVSVFYALFITYVLFLPPVFFGLFLYLVFVLYRQKKLTAVMIGKILVGLTLIGLIGGYYIFFGTFAGNLSSIFSSLKAEGYIYRDLFGNFILYLPLLLFVLVADLKKKEISFLVFLTAGFIFFVFVLLIAGLKGYISSYYFYKTYYVLWFLVIFISVKGIVQISTTNKILSISWLATTVLIPLVVFSGIEEKIVTTNYLFSPQVDSRTIGNIYFINKIYLDKKSPYDQNFTSFVRMCNSFIEDKKIKLPIISDWQTTYWYEGLTNQDLSDGYIWVTGFESFINRMTTEGISYIAVTYSSKEYNENIEFFSKLVVVQQNMVGAILKLNE